MESERDRRERADVSGTPCIGKNDLSGSDPDVQGGLDCPSGSVSRSSSANSSPWLCRILPNSFFIADLNVLALRLCVLCPLETVLEMELCGVCGFLGSLGCANERGEYRAGGWREVWDCGFRV